MYAQIAYFDGPRSTELVAANERAGRERIMPAILGDPEVNGAHVATFALRQPDGTEAVVVIADTEAALDRGRQIIMNTELLPGEDEALLPGPDRSERYEVVYAVEHGKIVEAARS